MFNIHCDDTNIRISAQVFFPVVYRISCLAEYPNLHISGSTLNLLLEEHCDTIYQAGYLLEYLRVPDIYCHLYHPYPYQISSRVLVKRNMYKFAWCRISERAGYSSTPDIRSLILAWFLYQMVAHFMLRTCDVNKVFFRKNCI